MIFWTLFIPKLGMAATSFVIMTNLKKLSDGHRYSSEIRAEVFKDTVCQSDIIPLIPEGYKIIQFWVVPCASNLMTNCQIAKTIITMKPEGNIISGVPVITGPCFAYND